MKEKIRELIFGTNPNLLITFIALDTLRLGLTLLHPATWFTMPWWIPVAAVVSESAWGLWLSSIGFMTIYGVVAEDPAYSRLGLFSIFFSNLFTATLIVANAASQANVAIYFISVALWAGFCYLRSER